jgi:hypothetical protein
MESDARMNLLHNWSFVQPKIDTGAGTVELDPKFVETQHRSLRRVAETVFRESLPATEAEADRFLAMHQARVKQSPHGLARMEKDLLELGFFNSASFTAAHFRAFAEGLPADERTLAGEFNKRAATRLIEEKGVKSFLSPAKFADIETAHRLRAWKASAAETLMILDYCQSQAKKGAVPKNIVSALEAMRDAGADFSKVTAHKYLAKDGPGLCKTLLDLGIATPAGIRIDVLAERHGGELRPLTPPQSPDFADMEFMCQVILELAAPEKYVPMRGNEKISYQNMFLREYTSGRLLKRRFMTRGTGPR